MYSKPNAGIAQSVVRITRNDEVVSSILTTSSIGLKKEDLGTRSSFCIISENNQKTGR